ncbi:MAG: hypothetical protein LBH01_08200 [Verrucomicrobiales bacterium]|jgi:hypothetical protein|nr:hypothetical protein [Verrucomicrobiales bacterium]
MPSYFFNSTRNAHKSITDLYDFVWPTAAAMWNLRWQVVGYLQIVPHATVKQLDSRFTEGTNITGVNYTRSCIEHTWDQQKEIFAKIILINVIAIYEGWLEEVLTNLDSKIKHLVKALQFPEGSNGNTKTKGIRTGINELTSVESDVLKKNFYSTFCNDRRYALAKLDAILLCYRFFKELRNCDMHGGGIAGQKLVDAYKNFLPIATTSDLGVKEIPKHHQVVLGSKIKVNLRGVVGFSDIILRLITTLDAELSRSKGAEKEFIKSWQQIHSKPITLPNDKKRRKNRIIRMVKKVGYPEPKMPEELEDWLKKMGLVRL